MDQNALSQSDSRISKSTISSEQVNEIACILHVDTNSRKLKVNGEFFSVVMVKNGCGQSGYVTLKVRHLKNEQKE